MSDWQPELCSTARAARREQVLSGRRDQPRVTRRPSATSPVPVDEADRGNVDLAKLSVCTTIYSLVEGVITYPYDLVKTRQQMAHPRSLVAQVPTTIYVHTVIFERGPSALYRGFGWNVLGGVPSEVAYYATYTHAKQQMLQTHYGQMYPSAVYMLAGLLSDVVSVLLWVPPDLISQRMQLQDAEHIQPIRHAPLAMQAKPRIAKNLRREEEAAAVLAVSGSLAGITSTVATNPLDVVKTRIQCTEPPLPVWQVVRGVLCESGWAGLYSGLIPRIVTAIPRSVFAVLAYEKAIAFCRRPADEAG